MPSNLHIDTFGDPSSIPVVFVHGSFGWGLQSFPRQMGLHSNHHLLIMDRRGFGHSPDGQVDFEVDAQDTIEIIKDQGHPAHLVGHSYGAVPCLLAAQDRPDLIRSLTLIEPSAFSLVRGNAAVEEFIGRMTAGILKDVHAPPKVFLEGFVTCMGYDRPNLPEPDEIMSRSIRASATERRPWMASINLQALKDAAIPTLIFSGGWDNAPPEAQRIGGNAFHAVAELLERELPGATRIVVNGSSHNPHMSAIFNREVQRFWHDVEHVSSSEPGN